MSIQNFEIESTIENILDGILNELTGQFDNKDQIEYAIELLKTKLDEVDVDDLLEN